MITYEFVCHFKTEFNIFSCTFLCHSLGFCKVLVIIICKLKKTTNSSFKKTLYLNGRVTEREAEGGRGREGERQREREKTSMS